MIVSITDQLLIVWPTVIPKYSLTSQKPASLTCEKNSDPAPTARASNATVGRSRPRAGRPARPGARRRDAPGGGEGGAGRGAGGQPDPDGHQPAQHQRGE